MNPTFEEKAKELWEKFVAYSNDLNNSDAGVIAAEQTYDKAYEDLCVKFSHPTGRPNRRR